MRFFELEPHDISHLSDADLREMVARLCEAELMSQDIHPSCVLWGGAQEAADGGIDVRVVDATPLSKPGFVKHTNTGFQVKKNSMSKAACKKEMLEKGELKKVIADLLGKKGSYVIVSGKDDCSDKMLNDRVLGMKSAIEGLPNSHDLHLDFYGRDRLSAWLRQFPSVALWVRSRLGKPLSGWRRFGKWTALPADQDDEFLFDEHPCVIDVNSQTKTPMTISGGIRLVREKYRKPYSVVRLTGLAGVGKTRFAQALFEAGVFEKPLPKTNVIYADLGDDLSPTASELVQYLIANDFSCYVVLDNCPADVHRRLQKEISSSQPKLSLLTIEYDISDDRPEETEVIDLKPSSEQTVSKLMQKRWPRLGRVNADRIAEFSGGNASIAIALASRVNSDETLASFSDNELFERLFNQRKGATEDLLKCAEVLSLVYSFYVSTEEYNDELNTLSKIGELERKELFRSYAELLRRQLSQKRGKWRAVLPHALANRLAQRALQNIDPDQINDELLKSGNTRLFKSCAHRLGFLHDSTPARNLALTWLKAGGPLHNISKCDAELLTALSHIAPVVPDAVLDTIEKASEAQGFCSINYKHYPVIVRLLRKIAYNDQHFDRAAELILRFAQTEKVEVMENTIASQLSSLFSLYLSGTQATPERRHSFVKRMLVSCNTRQLDIVEDILRSAFKAHHWSSCTDFNFGARSRDYGWEPKTNEEILHWYEGFIEQLVSLLDSKNEPIVNWAKKQLANNFPGLWNYAGCFDVLEKIVRKYAADGKWTSMWLSIKRTIHYTGNKHSPEGQARIEELAHLTAPADDLYSQLEAYVLTHTHDHADEESSGLKISRKVEQLGELAATEPEHLERLAPKLWKQPTNSHWSFGKGLAKGSLDQQATFDTLVQLMQKQELQTVQTGLFHGFIAAVHENDPILSRSLKESVLAEPELKPYFVDFLLSTKIEPWGTQKLIELAKAAELEASKFTQIRAGRAHEPISDDDLSKLLAAVNDLDNGIFATIEILEMRFFTKKASSYRPSNELRQVGRQAILKLLEKHRDEVNKKPHYEMDRVIEECLSEPAAVNEIRDIISSLCDGLEKNRYHAFETENIINCLVKNYPEYILDQVFLNSKNEQLLVNELSTCKVNDIGSPLNTVPIKRVLDWCNGNQDKIQKVAGVVSVYTPLDKESQTLDHPKKVVLSKDITSLLDAAENKAAIVKTIFSRCQPQICSGSRADILEVRSKALEKLLNHSSHEVQEMAKNQLVELNRSIADGREYEAKNDNQLEQTFE